MLLKNKILELLEKDSKISSQDISAILNEDISLIEKSICELEADKVICGYHTLINWEKTDNQNVSAIIELKVNPQKGHGFDKIAEKIYIFSEVESVYLMSGSYDLLVQLRKAPMREIANFVSSKLSVIDEVQATSTHVILKKYKDHGTLYVDDKNDKRQVITP